MTKIIKTVQTVIKPYNVYFNKTAEKSVHYLQYYVETLHEKCMVSSVFLRLQP